MNAVVMCVRNEPTPRNIPSTCYWAKIKILMSYVMCVSVQAGFREAYDARPLFASQ